MPRALTLCAEEGCGELVVRGRCEAHERAHKDRVNRRVGPARETHVLREVPNWRRIRANYLRRHPVCEEAGCTREATDVHHKVDRSEGGRSDDSNLEALCHSHHSSVTASRQVRVVRQA